jgi:hypothetical protein
MTVLEELLSQIKSDSIIEKIKTICDKIYQEEKGKITHPSVMPNGPNIFLSLEVPGRMQNEIAFLTLERELETQFIVVLYSINKTDFAKKKIDEISYKKAKVWEVKEEKPEKILAFYARQYSFLRGN